MGGVLTFDIYYGNIELSIFTFVAWLIIVIPLAILFRKYHAKYQGVDPGKTDEDFS